MVTVTYVLVCWGQVDYDEKNLIINGKKIRAFQEKEAGNIKWGESAVGRVASSRLATESERVRGANHSALGDGEHTERSLLASTNPTVGSFHLAVPCTLTLPIPCLASPLPP